MSSFNSNNMTPRMRPLPTRKGATLSVVDIGASKIVCLVAELQPTDSQEALKGRTHIARVIGIGHQSSIGLLKGGAIVDLDAAERGIRHAVSSAERMAKAEVQSVIVNLTGGRLSSSRNSAEITLNGPVTQRDISHSLDAASQRNASSSRTLIHSLPIRFRIDNQSDIVDPIGMIGEKLGVNLHTVNADASAVQNIILAVERCRLDVEAIVATPYASGLSALVDDEVDMGCVIIDMGAGSTSFGVFENGCLVHSDAIALGGNHVTMDIARGLMTRFLVAERLKIMHGTAILTGRDDRDLIAVPHVDTESGEGPKHIQKGQIPRIVRPRIEEIFEFVRDRLKRSGFGYQMEQSVILTGGACQLAGVPEIAAKVLHGRVRIGRPLGIKGLPQAAKGPGFSTAVGLLVYPQLAHMEYFEPKHLRKYEATGTNGYFSRVGRWIRESF